MSFFRWHPAYILLIVLHITLSACKPFPTCRTVSCFFFEPRLCFFLFLHCFIWIPFFRFQFFAPAVFAYPLLPLLSFFKVHINNFCTVRPFSIYFASLFEYTSVVLAQSGLTFGILLSQECSRLPLLLICHSLTH